MEISHGRKEESWVQPWFIGNMLKGRRNANLYHQKDLYLAAKGLNPDARSLLCTCPSANIFKNFTKLQEGRPGFKDKAKAIEKGENSFFPFNEQFRPQRGGNKFRSLNYHSKWSAWNWIIVHWLIKIGNFLFRHIFHKYVNISSHIWISSVCAFSD